MNNHFTACSSPWGSEAGGEGVEAAGGGGEGACAAGGGVSDFDSGSAEGSGTGAAAGSDDSAGNVPRCKAVVHMRTY